MSEEQALPTDDVEEAGDGSGEEMEEEDQDEGPSAPEKKAKPTITGRGVTLQMLIADNIIQQGESVLSLDYLGQKFTADLLANGNIKSNETGQTFVTPSSWAIFCKQLVNPGKRSGCGWSTVKYKGRKLDTWKANWFRQIKPRKPNIPGALSPARSAASDASDIISESESRLSELTSRKESSQSQPSKSESSASTSKQEKNSLESKSESFTSDKTREKSLLNTETNASSVKSEVTVPTPGSDSTIPILSTDNNISFAGSSISSSLFRTESGSSLFRSEDGPSLLMGDGSLPLFRKDSGLPLLKTESNLPFLGAATQASKTETVGAGVLDLTTKPKVEKPAEDTRIKEKAKSEVCFTGVQEEALNLSLKAPPTSMPVPMATGGPATISKAPPEEMVVKKRPEIDFSKRKERKAISYEDLAEYTSNMIDPNHSPISNLTHNQDSQESEVPNIKDGQESEVPTNKDGQESEVPTNQDGQESEVPNIKDGQESEVPNIKDGQESEVPNIKDGQESEVPNIKDGQESEVPNIKDGQESEVPNIKDGQESEVPNNQDGYESDVSNTQDGHESDVSNNQDSHESDVSNTQDGHKSDVSNTQDGHKSDVSNNQDGHESDVSNNQDGHESDVPSPTEQKDRDKNHYEAMQRVRTFQKSWLTRFPWLIYVQCSEEKDMGYMYCEPCCEFPECANPKSALVRGSSKFLIESLKSHSVSKKHIHCTQKKKAANMTDKAEKSYRSETPSVDEVLSSEDVKISDQNLLVECESFEELKKAQPYTVSMSTNSLLVMDFHCHLTSSEVVGYLGGKWDSVTQHLSIQQAFPCRCRLGDTYGAATAEEEIRASMKHMSMSLVGWYHSHPYCLPEPSVKDIDCQMSYQLRMKNAKSTYFPCVGIINSPYFGNSLQTAAAIQMFMVMPPPFNLKTDFGVPMELKYSVKQNHSICAELLCEIKDLADFYRGAPDWIAFKHKWQSGITYLDKLKASLSLKLPVDQVEQGSFLDFLNEVLFSALPQLPPVPT